jgi:RecA-family ATPase
LDDDYAADEGQPKPSSAGTPFEYALLKDLKPNLASQFVIKDLLPRAALGCCYAQPGAGKTALIIDMALHVAAGREYRGRRVERQPVVFVALEGHSGIHNRMIAAARHLGIEDAPFGVIKAVESFRNPETAARVAATAKAIREQYGPDGEAFDNPVVVIDTFQAALGPGGSDCRPEDVSELIENVKKLLIVPGMTVIIIHHSGKDASRGARGWSGLLAALDFEFEVDRDDDLRTLNITKMRDASDAQAGFCYVLRAMELGLNPYGEPVTGVYVEHRADNGKGKQKGKRISPKARAAYEMLWAMIKDSSRSQLLDGGPLRCVLMHHWRDACCHPGVLGQIKDPANRRKKFYAARDELLEKEMITVDCQDDQGDDYNARVYPCREGE